MSYQLQTSKLNLQVLLQSIDVMKYEIQVKKNYSAFT